MSDLRPWDITKLTTGSVRVMLAPTTEAIAALMTDCFLKQAPYTKQGTWFDLGAAKSGSNYQRGVEASGISIQQETGDILEEITAVNRSFTLSVSEIAAENIKIIEEAQAIGTITTAGETGDKEVEIGTFEGFTPYRLALAGLRPKDAGIVTEASTLVRGRLVFCTLNRVKLTADNVAIGFEKGQLSEAQVTFKAYPEPGETQAAAHGRWLFEQAGTFT